MTRYISVNCGPNPPQENVAAEQLPTHLTIVNAGSESTLACFKNEDDFETFKERLEYLAANMMKEERKVAILLILSSKEIYKM